MATASNVLFSWADVEKLPSCGTLGSFSFWTRSPTRSWSQRWKRRAAGTRRLSGARDVAGADRRGGVLAPVHRFVATRAGTQSGVAHRVRVRPAASPSSPPHGARTRCTAFARGVLGRAVPRFDSQPLELLAFLSPGGRARSTGAGDVRAPSRGVDGGAARLWRAPGARRQGDREPLDGAGQSRHPRPRTAMPIGGGTRRTGSMRAPARRGRRSRRGSGTGCI